MLSKLFNYQDQLDSLTIEDCKTHYEEACQLGDSYNFWIRTLGLALLACVLFSSVL